MSDLIHQITKCYGRSHTVLYRTSSLPGNLLYKHSLARFFETILWMIILTSFHMPFRWNVLLMWINLCLMIPTVWCLVACLENLQTAIEIWEALYLFLNPLSRDPFNSFQFLKRCSRRLVWEVLQRYLFSVPIELCTLSNLAMCTESERARGHSSRSQASFVDTKFCAQSVLVTIP